MAGADTPARLVWSKNRVNPAGCLVTPVLMIAAVVLISSLWPNLSFLAMLVVTLMVTAPVLILLTPKDAQGICPHCGLLTVGPPPAFDCKVCRKRVAVVQSGREHTLRGV